LQNNPTNFWKHPNQIYLKASRQRPYSRELNPYTNPSSTTSRHSEIYPLHLK